jgi:hypothetical protein
MTSYTVPQLVSESQNLNVSRYSLPSDSGILPDSDLSRWHSRKVAVMVALCMLNGATNGIPVTLNCHPLEA